MSEIEKMMQNAGIRKGRMSDEDCAEDCLDYECKNCRYSNYPPFTAEKQLEIVKFMLHKGIYYDTDGDTYWFHISDEIENATYRPFEEAIAEFINVFWQLLIEKERKQIKEILE